MDRLLVAMVIVAVVAAVALLIERRRPEPPTAGRWPVPVQLDRDDFDAPTAPWLVAVFTSAACESCAKAVSQAALLASGRVSVQEVEVGTRPDLHQRYGIEAVPTLVVADSEGVVQASFVGPPPATELWAAVAEVRQATGE